MQGFIVLVQKVLGDRSFTQQMCSGIVLVIRICVVE